MINKDPSAWCITSTCSHITFFTAIKKTVQRNKPGFITFIGSTVADCGKQKFASDASKRITTPVWSTQIKIAIMAAEIAAGKQSEDPYGLH